jgi:hypothetical protein
MAIHKAGGCPNTHAFTKQLDDLNYLLMVNPQAVERLFFTECFVASHTAITLDNPIHIFEFAIFLGFAFAAVTRHLTLSRPRLKLCVYLYDTQL